jgi:hypothetical protein
VGCGQVPFSSFVIGMKYGQATSFFSDTEFGGTGYCNQFQEVLAKF